MTASQSSSHEDLFVEASRLPAAERPAFLAHACGGDQQLLAELDSLLRAHDQASDFLETPAIVSGDLSAGAGENDAHILPERIGRYTILGLLGEGGMGTVYLARQDGTSRDVALKVMRSGYASGAMRRRFEQEARTLAMLHHPGIAQVYEAGLAAGERSAQPFFAMELVHGKPLNVFAREAGLTVRQRLELIASVCDAVEHAHRRGVVHRDLKPANVLVDKQGRPRVLDFGVARASSPDSALTTLHTRPGQLIGTLAYMAPEQIAGGPGAVDGRCDVYALGVLLYELLAGPAPVASAEVPLPEILRRIQEQDAPLLGTVDIAFRGDIETIASKALEKDPERRYESAAALAEDIRRHLRHEPILARAPGVAEQASKFVRRNRMLVGATSAVFVSLVLLAAGVTWSLLRALEAERIAVAEKHQAGVQAMRAEAVSRFLQDMLGGVDPSVAQAADTMLLRKILDAASERASQLGGTPEVEATVRFVIGGSYMFAGLYPSAEEHLQRAYELRCSALGERHTETLQAGNRLAVLHHWQGRFAEAERLYRLVLEGRRSGPPGGTERRLFLESVNNLGAFYLELDRPAEAEPLCVEAFEGRRLALGAEHPETLESEGNLGGLYWRLGRYERVEPLWAHVAGARVRLLGSEHPATLAALGNLALLYSRTGRVEEAAALLAEVLEGRRRVLGSEHPETLRTIMNLAPILADLGRFAPAEALYGEVLDVQPRVLGEGHLQTLLLMNNLASLHLSQGRPGDAGAILGKVVDHAKHSLPAGSVYLPMFVASRAVALAAQGCYAEAESGLLEAHSLLAPGDTGSQAVWIIQSLVRLYEEWEREGGGGRGEEAAAWRDRLPAGAAGGAP
jgi:eukaryotic-like serine/threonine-protein kinase